TGVGSIPDGRHKSGKCPLIRAECRFNFGHPDTTPSGFRATHISLTNRIQIRSIYFWHARRPAGCPETSLLRYLYEEAAIPQDQDSEARYTRGCRGVDARNLVAPARHANERDTQRRGVALRDQARWLPALDSLRGRSARA